MNSEISIACVLLWAAHSVNATPPKQPDVLFASMTSPSIKTGAQINLDVRINPRQYGTPLKLIVELPAGAEFLASIPKANKRPHYANSYVWEGLFLSTSTNHAHLEFKLPYPGYYKTRLMVDHDSLTVDQLAEIRPRYRAAHPRHPSGDRGDITAAELLDNIRYMHKIDDDTFFIRINQDDGRVERWDFKSVWKRLKHWSRYRNPRF